MGGVGELHAAFSYREPYTWLLLSAAQQEIRVRFGPNEQTLLEMTRGSITGQVKALSMIVAMQNFIPDRLAVSSSPQRASEKKSAPAPPAPACRGACHGAQPQIYAAAWRGGQKATTIDPQPTAAPDQEEDSPARPGVPWGVPEPAPAPGSAAEVLPDPGPSQSTFANRCTPSGPPEPYVPVFAPDTIVPFSIKKNPLARPR
jgi:hypothetical protein